ncbi:hypothetical protein [Thermosyntropha sp.]|uniref:hypothetical protein n=1 Tax=Thermosyntropha sp. TaxID=2740820 RepID=UPI0025FE3FE3|nr:hypothetical protein [Thermosyntropha sp.]MBO8158183.1 hypothetical protein [Thermosyntropha sp.]
MLYCRAFEKLTKWWSFSINSDDMWNKRDYREFIDWMYCHGIDVERYLPYWK